MALTPMDRARAARGEPVSSSVQVHRPTPAVFAAPRVALVRQRESRTVEATADQLVQSGALGGAYGIDPVDGDSGYQRFGVSGRAVPTWTLEKARTFSVAAYRMNPMARAIIDTYTSFCVGDSGVTFQCSSDEVRPVVDEFWNDPRNNLAALQTLMLQDKMLMGELVYEMMVGPTTGVTRFSPIDPTRVTEVDVFRGNPLWPSMVHIRNTDGTDQSLSVVSIDDLTGRRTGDVIFSPGWKALLTDRRGYPFLAPVLDDLDDYDMVLSNLIDRTALARYLVWDVTVEGDDKAVQKFIKDRGGRFIPPSGSVEVHNNGVTWKPQTAVTGAQEDTTTSKAILTNVAGGAGLAKTWLAEPEDANRATSLTMAEPVRRRVGGVQNMWLADMRYLVQFAVDQAVAAGRIPALVDATDSTSGTTVKVPAAQTVTVTGPEIAAADAQVTAQILQNLATSLSEMVVGKIMSPKAARVAARKAWEQFVGVPWTSDLEVADATADDLADELDKADPANVTLKLA